MRLLVQAVVLFVAGISGTAVLQSAGLMPGNLIQAVAARVGPFGYAPVPPRAAASVEPLTSAVPRPVPPTPEVTATRVERLTGDLDPTRNALRRGVIVAAREALVAPCDIDRRAAFQMSLRDYARAWANSPRQARERADFRTPLDEEAARAVAAAHRAGLIDPDLVERWRTTERTGVQEMLSRHGVTLAGATANACPERERRA